MRSAWTASVSTWCASWWPTAPPCMGPVTSTGCGVLCPSHDRPCYGCFGPSAEPDPDALAHRFEQLGLKPEAIRRLFHAFLRERPRIQGGRKSLCRTNPSRRMRSAKGGAQPRLASESFASRRCSRRRRSRGDHSPARGPCGRRATAHLRGASVLRGILAGTVHRRGARHHRTDLRHLPGCLSDECLPRLGVDSRDCTCPTAPGAAPLALLRRVDREPCAAHCLSACSRLPGLRKRVRDGPELPERTNWCATP